MMTSAVEQLVERIKKEITSGKARIEPDRPEAKEASLQRSYFLCSIPAKSGKRLFFEVSSTLMEYDMGASNEMFYELYVLGPVPNGKPILSLATSESSPKKGTAAKEINDLLITHQEKLQKNSEEAKSRASKTHDEECAKAILKELGD